MGVCMDNEYQPLISFVVLCYNTENYVADCIWSILRIATDLPFEIVAIDDHSPDNTFEVLRSFTDPRLRIFRNERNLGQEASIGKAMRQTRGEFVARIDSDDRYRPEFLNRTMPIFAKYPEVGMVYGDASTIGEAGQEYAARSDRRHGGRDFKGCELIELLESNFICAPTIIARRELWIRRLPVPAKFAFHDWYFTIGMARETEFYYVDAVIADYRVHAGNMHNRTIRDKTEEKSILWLLERIYASGEGSAPLQAGKMRARRSIYANQYRALADKYFGAFMNADARRCYFQAIGNCPAYLLSPAFSRRFAATLVGRNLYEWAKALFKRIAAPSPAEPVTR
jgi:glycosyltransferase involved in cell wall biosynthesis